MDNQESNKDWKKRGKGKIVSTVKHYAFYSGYLKHTLKSNRIPRQEYNKFLADLMRTLMDAVIEEHLEVKFSNIGSFRVKETKMQFITADGQMNKSIPTNWDASWKYWRELHPDKTDVEIIALSNKPIIRHENESRNNHIYRFNWDKRTTLLKNKSYYTFRPTRLAKEKLARILKTNENVTFYG